MLSFTYKPLMLSVVILNVVMLSVVAPTNWPNKLGCSITIERKSLIETNTLAY